MVRTMLYKSHIAFFHLYVPYVRTMMITQLTIKGLLTGHNLLVYKKDIKGKECNEEEYNSNYH